MSRRADLGSARLDFLSRPIEVKRSGKVHSTDLRALRTFRDDYPEASVALLYLGDERLSIDGIPRLPVSTI